MKKENSHREQKNFAPRGKKDRTMAEAEKAAGTKKSKWATMVETSQAIDRKRHGKTQKDHKSGAWHRNEQNKQARAAWSGKRGTGGKGVTYMNGPALEKDCGHTLGGKGNSSLPFKMCAGRGRTQDHRPTGGNPTFKKGE